MDPYLTFAAEIDVRALGGVTLFTRGASAVAFPAFDAALDEGVFEDVVDLANSRGSAAVAVALTDRRDLQSEVEFGLGVGAYVAINADDRVVVWSTAPFTVLNDADNPTFGFALVDLPAVASGGGFIATAPNAWKRGNVEGRQLRLQVGGVGWSSIPLSPDYIAQGVPVMIRRVGRKSVVGGGALGDYDVDDMAGALCLESLDNAVNDATLNRIRHYLSDDGFYTMTWPLSLGLAAPVWNSSAMRNILGFRGTETPVTTSTVVIYTADRQPAVALTPARPWRGRPLQVGDERGDSERLVNGGAAGDHVASWRDEIYRFWVEGIDYGTRTVDLTRHFLDAFLPSTPKSRKMTVMVGRDTRRTIDSGAVTISQVAHSDLYVSTGCGGRRRVCRSPDDASKKSIEFTENGGGDFYASVEFQVSQRRVGT